MLTFILLNIIVAWTAILVVYKALRIKEFINSLLALFVIYFTQIVLMELVLGVTNTLFLNNIIIFTLVVFIFIYLLTKNKNSAFGGVNFRIYFDKLVDRKIYIFIISVVASFFIVKVLINLFNPPFGWDSLNYHFTFPVEWFKFGNLNVPITIFDDPSPTYYPINGSLFYFWLIIPFRSVFLADLGQLPFFIIALISIYSIGKKIGLNKINSFYSLVLFALIPNFFKQLQIAYVDIMVAALFLVCINYLLILKEEFRFKNALIFSLSLGLLIGIKTTALPFSILLIIPFLMMLFKYHNTAYLVFVFILSVLILGGFSYLRNFIQTGNPLYPLNFALFDITIFKGIIDKTVYSSHFSISDYSLGKMLFHEGLGAQALLLILPGMFLALPVVFIKKRRDLNFSFIYFSLLPIFIYFIYRYIVPLANVRYLYAMMGIGIILGFYFLELLKARRWMINILVIVCMFSSIPSLAKKQELVASVVFTILIFIILSNFKKFRIFSNKKFLLMAVMILIIVILFLAQSFYKTNEFSRYYKMIKYSGFWGEATKAWDWLNTNSSGNNIAYTGRAVPFPLYGSGLKNNVYYVSVNSIQPAKLHYFSNSKYEYGPGFESLLKSIEQKGNYRGNIDYDIWLSNLFKADTDYLFVYSLQQTKSTIFPIEDSWAMKNPDKFKPVFTNNSIHIYKVIK